MHKEEHVRQRTRVCCEPPHIPVQNAVGRLNSVDAAIASRYSGDKWLVTKTYKEGMIQRWYVQLPDKSLDIMKYMIAISARLLDHKLERLVKNIHTRKN